MAPAIHPACTPSASCATPRCHPSLPPCKRPEACMAQTIRKGKRPCSSAASIMSTRSKASCSGCQPGKPATRMGKRAQLAHVEKFLKRKSREKKLRKYDRLHGTQKYLKYQRSKGTPRANKECCTGKGHRGRLKRKCWRQCCAKCCGINCRQGCMECCDECCAPCCGTCCSRYCTIL